MSSIQSQIPTCAVRSYFVRRVQANLEVFAYDEYVQYDLD